MGARLYDPTTTTFLSPDPLTPPAGALWANNPYDYANNNPLTLTDPLGTHPVTDDQLALLTHPIGTLAHYVANSVSTLVHHITDPISHWWTAQRPDPLPGLPDRCRPRHRRYRRSGHGRRRTPPSRGHFRGTHLRRLFR